MDWDDRQASLVVTKDAIVGQLVAECLAPNLTAEEAMRRGVEVHSDETRWSVSCIGGDYRDIEDQVKELKAIFASRAAEMRALQDSGHVLHVEISGIVETGAKLRLSPSALVALGSLPVPVFFKTFVPADLQEEDPLAWLD
ncbi:hypothetical protein [Streptomyces lydicus]|uniref:hypothetical protein n=1 Tax=Streptomyces lydicus TaxID=47763 RepID=UPI0033290815